MCVSHLHVCVCVCEQPPGMSELQRIYFSFGKPIDFHCVPGGTGDTGGTTGSDNSIDTPPDATTGMDATSGIVATQLLVERVRDETKRALEEGIVRLRAFAAEDPARRTIDRYTVERWCCPLPVRDTLVTLSLVMFVVNTVYSSLRHIHQVFQ